MATNFAKTLKLLASEEAKLRARKNAARQDALETVNELIAIFEFKASDLTFGAKPKICTASKKAAGSDSRKKIEPKYRAPSGETWTGRGKQPLFIREALSKGVTLESMLIAK